MRSVCLLAAAAVTVAASGLPARAAEQVYVQGPGGPFVGYTVPVIALQPGNTITFVNLDAYAHDVVSREKGPDAGWCDEAGYGPGKCPRFWSPLIGLGATTAVYGLDNVEAGAQYEFFCSAHPNTMVGTMVVLPR